jgi:hypothetical protein
MKVSIAHSSRSSVLVILLAAAGCGGGETSAGAAKGTSVEAKVSGSDESTGKSDAAAAAENDPAKAAEQMREGMKQFNNGKDIKALSPSELKQFLPETIGPAKRSNSKAEHTNAMGMDLATAEADYEPEYAADAQQHPSYHVKITDLGNMSGAMLGGFAGWAMVQTESETETGYEKTVQYKGFPGRESYDRETKYGSLNVFVAKRFTVEVTGNDVTIEQVRTIVDGIDVAKLGTMGQ